MPPCSDLCHQLGDVEPVTSVLAGGMPQSRLTRRDPVLMDYVPLTPATRRLSRATLDVQLNDYQ